MVAMLICGVSLGAGGMTLMWSGMMDRQRTQHSSQMGAMKGLIEQWQSNFESMKNAAGRFEAVAVKNEGTARECIQMLQARR